MKKNVQQVATNLSIGPDDFDCEQLKAHQLFGEQPGNLLEELDQPLVA